MAAESYPHAGHRKRLREKFLCNGAEALSETELLELLLFFAIPRVDTRPTAETLLAAFGSLDGVLAAAPEELHAVASLNSSVDALFSLLHYLTERVERPMHKEQFSSAEFLCIYLPRQFSGFRKERAILFFLDDSGTLLHRQTVMSNETGAVRVTLRSLLEPAKRLGASAVILAHNHPNGKAIPSGADLDATRRLYHALQNYGLLLLEHYVVAGQDCVPILHGNEAFMFGTSANNTEAADGFDLH